MLLQVYHHFAKIDFAGASEKNVEITQTVREEWQELRVSVVVVTLKNNVDVGVPQNDTVVCAASCRSRGRSC